MVQSKNFHRSIYNRNNVSLGAKKNELTLFLINPMIQLLPEKMKNYLYDSISLKNLINIS